MKDANSELQVVEDTWLNDTKFRGVVMCGVSSFFQMQPILYGLIKCWIKSSLVDVT